jgi:hypothetical protein
MITNTHLLQTSRRPINRKSGANLPHTPYPSAQRAERARSEQPDCPVPAPSASPFSRLRSDR